jgi:hypothetical protein
MNLLLVTVILALLGIGADAAVVRAVAIPVTLPECGSLTNVPSLAVDVGTVGRMPGVADVGVDVAPVMPVVGVPAIGGDAPVLGAKEECRRFGVDGVAVFGVMGMSAGVTGENWPFVTRLTETLPVDPGVPVMSGLWGVVETGVVGLPFVGAIATVAGAEVLAPVASVIESVRSVSDNIMPQLISLKVVARQDLDPFLGLVDIWKDGPLGELKKAAKRAAEAGDEAEYRRLAGAYWQAMTDATGRRDANQKRVEAEKMLGPPARGRGSSVKGGQTP